MTERIPTAHDLFVALRDELPAASEVSRNMLDEVIASGDGADEVNLIHCLAATMVAITRLEAKYLS